MISFIIPAHNEEFCLKVTLEAIHSAVQLTGLSYEIIVVDDASTDKTVDVAQDNGAIVISKQNRQIAATRNAGAAVAKGKWFFFVDADTVINETIIRQSVSALEHGAAGGGAACHFGAPENFGVSCARIISVGLKMVGLTGGAFLFCDRGTFQAIGGFIELLYAGEDVFFVNAVKAEGPFVLIKESVFTSPRRVRSLSFLKMISMLVIIIFPPILTQRWAIKHIWYDSNRENDENIDKSAFKWTVQLFWFLILLLVISFVAPWPEYVREILKGNILIGFKEYIDIVLVHFAMVMFLILTFYSMAMTFKQKQWAGRLREMACFAFYLYMVSIFFNYMINIWK